jgi:hypothetical protein
MYPVEILERMRSERDLILGQLIARKADLETYRYLQGALPSTDVSNDADFQRRFNAFYKMRSKPRGWYQLFFGILQRDKQARNSSSFEKLIREIFGRWGEVHPSFTSKLLATIDPESPVYDGEVCRNLGIKPIAPIIDPEARIIKAISNFRALERFHSAAKDTSVARDLIAAFDAALDSFAGFTAVKKLDLMLWQWRPPKCDAAGKVPRVDR